MEMSFVCIGSSNSNFQICSCLGSEKQPQLLGNFPSVKATLDNVSRIYDLSFLLNSATSYNSLLLFEK